MQSKISVARGSPPDLPSAQGPSWQGLPDEVGRTSLIARRPTPQRPATLPRWRARTSCALQCPRRPQRRVQPCREHDHGHCCRYCRLADSTVGGAVDCGRVGVGRAVAAITEFRAQWTVRPFRRRSRVRHIRAADGGGRSRHVCRAVSKWLLLNLRAGGWVMWLSGHYPGPARQAGRPRQRMRSERWGTIGPPPTPSLAPR
jgi:hypothetical protein